MNCGCFVSGRTTVEKSVSMNTTVNGSLTIFSNCSSLINPKAGKIGATVALSLSLVFSLVGNCLIVLIVYKTPTLRKPINLLIANMAMSDLLHPIFLFPVLLTEMHIDSWLIGGTLGQALCMLHSFLKDVSLFVSIQSLVLIAVDRFGAVVLPLRSPLITRKLCLFFIIATWIIAMAVLSPCLVTYKLFKYRERLLCVSLWIEAFGWDTYANYVLAVIVVFFFIPFVLVVVLYSIILMKLKMQVHPGEQSANADEQRNRRNRNVLKMAIAIVVVFFVCFIPNFSNFLIVRLSAPSSSILFSCSFGLYYIVAVYVSLTNSAINPMICLIFSSNYRQALKRLVNCCDTVQD